MSGFSLARSVLLSTSSGWVSRLQAQLHVNHVEPAAKLVPDLAEVRDPRETHRLLQREARGLLAVRVLRPPLPLEVLTREDAGIAGPRPIELRAVVGEETARRPRLTGPVRVAAGPWRLDEGWWTEERTEREYWDLELAGGILCRVYREPRSGDWYADGIYD